MTTDRDHPGLYGAVMGTSIVAIAVDDNAKAWSATWAQWVAIAFLFTASVLAVVLLPHYVRRVRNRGSLVQEFADPNRGPLLATLPAGLLLLAVGWAQVAPDVIPLDVAIAVSTVLLALGAVLALAVSLMWVTSLLHAGTSLDCVSGAWLIPPAINLIAALGIGPIAMQHPDHAQLLVVVGFMFYGIGLIFFFVVLSLLFARLVFKGPLTGVAAPSMWIPLAPAALTGLSFARLLEVQGTQTTDSAGQEISAGEIALAIGIGFGLWWAALSLIELYRCRQTGRLPVGPGWWAFTFPNGAMAIALTVLGTMTGLAVVQVLGLVATLILVAVWAVVFGRNFRALI